jgi:formiminoglutamase
MRVLYTQAGKWPANISETRFAATIQRESAEGCAVAIVGLADDTGVRLNGGRPGAKHGPTAFRAALASYGAVDPAGNPWPRMFDAGDVKPARTLEETHRRVTAVTGELLDAGLFPIAIGGGHDLTFPFVRAVAQRFPRLAGVYFDAHLDVRETAGSGMAFRQLVQDCGVNALHLHGFRPMVNSREHFAWFRAHGGMVHPDDARVALPRRQDLFVSLDLDVLDAAHAPGVSAMNPAGWTVHGAAAWMRACGANERVRCFDLMELNPRFDSDQRTARVAAFLFLSFLSGFVER